MNPAKVNVLGFDQPATSVTEKNLVMDHVFLGEVNLVRKPVPVTGVSGNAIGTHTRI
jgi:hypothetical protein